MCMVKSRFKRFSVMACKVSIDARNYAFDFIVSLRRLL